MIFIISIIKRESIIGKKKKYHWKIIIYTESKHLFTFHSATSLFLYLSTCIYQLALPIRLLFISRSRERVTRSLQRLKLKTILLLDHTPHPRCAPRRSQVIFVFLDASATARGWISANGNPVGKARHYTR